MASPAGLGPYDIQYDEMGNVISGSYSSPDVSRKSKTTDNKNKTPNPPKIIQGKGQNQLNRYRSYNYIFTLASLDINSVAYPSSYRDSELNNVILKSGGKGQNALSGRVTPQTKTYTPSTKSADSNVTTKNTPSSGASTSTTYVDKSGEVLVDGFNQESPGRFDMFIENVEIESVWAASETSSVSQPTKLSFDVIEPYSINGFIEALMTTSVAAGYDTYTHASFLLKIEFIGYPDGADFTNAEPVPYSTRYFPIKLTNVEVTIDDRGTKYKVSAIPYNEAGFGNASTIKKPISLRGGTVADILNDMFKNLNDQIKDSDDDSSKTPFKDHDEYKITFPSWSDTQGFVGETNEISGTKVLDVLKDNSSYSFPDIAKNTKPDAYDPKSKNQPSPQQKDANAESEKTVPLGSTTVQFPEGSRIVECISNIIRDSEYLKNILKKISSDEWQTVVNSDGMVTYFMVKLEIFNKAKINPDTKKPFQIYQFVVVPHQIHYTRLPKYGGQKIDSDKLSQVSLREYNYIYTGKNVDVLNFKLDFNTLYFEAIPNALGASDGPPSRYAAGRNDKTDPKSVPDDPNIAKQSGVPVTGAQVDASQSSVRKDSGNQQQDDPYAVMARNMHDAVINSKGSMLTGDIEIIGDPFYLATGGIGNYNPTPAPGSPRYTTDGEVAHNYGDVLVTINFINPIDIDTLEGGKTSGGRFYFDAKPVPFSGVYRVTGTNSTFRDGQFKQKLTIIRIPGQISDSTLQVSIPGSKIQQTADPQDVRASDAENPAKDTVVNTDSGVSGSRASTLNLANQLNRGLPSPGLPGQMSNFTAAFGGLGGALLNSVSGGTNNLLGRVDNLVGVARDTSQIFGGSVPGGVYQTQNGIRAGINGVAVIQGTVLGTGGIVANSANMVNSLSHIKNPGKDLAGVIANIAIGKINQLAVPGSGIGIGGIPYVPVSGAASIVASGAALTLSALSASNMQGSAPGVTSPLTGIAAGIGIATMSRIANLSGPQQAGLINGVNIATQVATWGVPQDPTALASQFGLNAAQIAGLSPNLASRVLNDLRTISNIIPQNTDIGAYSARGLNINSLDRQGLKSLPPNQPYSTAPDPAVDSTYLDGVSAKGGATALARAYGVYNAARISQSQLPAVQRANILSFVAPTLLGALSSYLPAEVNDAAQTGLRVLTAANQVSQTIKMFGSKENNLSNVQYKTGYTVATGASVASSVTSKFGSKVNTTNPLDRLIKNDGWGEG